MVSGSNLRFDDFRDMLDVFGSVFDMMGRMLNLSVSVVFIDIHGREEEKVLPPELNGLNPDHELSLSFTSWTTSSSLPVTFPLDGIILSEYSPASIMRLSLMSDPVPSVEHIEDVQRSSGVVQREYEVRTRDYWITLNRLSQR